MGIKFEIDDAPGEAKIRALEKALASPRPLYAAIGRVMVNRIRICFRMGKDPWGKPWQALKLRKGQPLRDTGRLQRSVSYTASDDDLLVGTNVLYAPTHQFGATIVPKKANLSPQALAEKRLVFKGPNGTVIFAKKVVVPARPFMPLRTYDGPPDLPPAWSAAASKAINDYLQSIAD